MAEQGTKAEGKWLLLLHQLPTRPSKGRVKTWRRLQQIGAVPHRNSVYVLPNSPQAHEDFEWMKTEIIGMGGQATVVAGNVLDADAEAEIVAAFRASRESDYQKLRAKIAALDRRARTLSAAGGRRLAPTLRRPLRACRDRLAEIVAIDFFAAPARTETEAALNRLDTRATGAPGVKARHQVNALSTGDYRQRTWVTRTKPGVDRMASAWLIRTFIDPQAVFSFGDRASSQQVPFDMYEGEFSHQGGLCTFEVLEKRFHITDPAVRRIGEIVHDLDLKDARFRPPEAATVGALVDGIRATHDDDTTALARGIDLFQALHRSMASMTSVGTAVRRRRARSKRAPR